MSILFGYCNAYCQTGSTTENGFCRGHWLMLSKKSQVKIIKAFKAWERAVLQAGRQLEKENHDNL